MKQLHSDIYHQLDKARLLMKKRYESAEARIANCAARQKHVLSARGGSRFFCPNCGEPELVFGAFGVRRVARI